jgi:hypothetical protein
MTLPQSVRSFLPLVIGLVVGGVGASLFHESMPGAPGSAEEQAKKLEVEKERLQRENDALKAAGALPRGERGLFRRISSGGVGGRTMGEDVRSLFDDLREGKPVNVEDLFRVTKPLARDLAPLFDRIRVREERRMIDSMTGELARKYNLTSENQVALKKWFEEKTSVEARRITDLLSQDHTRLEDVMRATRDYRPDDGLESFMAGVLSPDKLTAFNEQRMNERAQRVQQEADRTVERINSIVGLDDAQRDQIFGIMARGSRDYDPSMAIEGARGEIAAIPTGDRMASMLALLKPDQRAAFDAEQQHRREEASKDMEAVGLTLPPNWEMLDWIDFH